MRFRSLARFTSATTERTVRQEKRAARTGPAPWTPTLVPSDGAPIRSAVWRSAPKAALAVPRVRRAWRACVARLTAAQPVTRRGAARARVPSARGRRRARTARRGKSSRPSRQRQEVPRSAARGTPTAAPKRAVARTRFGPPRNASPIATPRTMAKFARGARTARRSPANRCREIASRCETEKSRLFPAGSRFVASNKVEPSASTESSRHAAGRRLPELSSCCNASPCAGSLW
jgi:hypothetical protein